MDKTTLEKFFTAKFFKIPRYQRDYAWDLGNIDDLFNDVIEALETSTSHYIGTFILSRKPGQQFYNVVDGQQRLTTITMLAHALVQYLPKSDMETRIIRTNHFLVADGRPRLELLGDNETFFRVILEGKSIEPATGSQRRLAEAYSHISLRVAKLQEQEPSQVKRWLNCIAELQVMEFIEDDDGRAIRIFQTVNDRGKPLSNMEKAKSLLIYYSNRFLAGALDALVNDKFGEIFRAYEAIKEHAKRPGFEIDLINQARFTEDSVMTYHFLAFPSNWHDYSATAGYVLSTFLKRALKEQQSIGPQELSKFIESYVSDLQAFFQALKELVARMGTDVRYYKFLSWLNPSATLYPLVVRLAMRGLLDAQVPSNPSLTFRDLIETVDVRVYKTRRTNPEKDMAKLAQWATVATPTEIANSLLTFLNWFMTDASFRAALEGEVIGNQAIHLIFLEHEEKLRIAANGAPLDVAALKGLADANLAIEHVLAQEPTFSVKARGFADKDDYEASLHLLGNLTLLEEALNSRGRNKPPEVKGSDSKLYKASNLQIIRDLGAQFQAKGGLWAKTDVETRTAVLTDFVLARWPLWQEA